MVVVLTSIRKSDKWYVRGYNLVGDCDSAKTPPVWSGTASLAWLSDIFTFIRPYVTKSLWDSATDEVKNIIKGRIAGVVGPNYIRWELREGRWWCSFFNPDSIIPVKVCTEGEKRNPKTCWDGTTIHEQVCSDNAWIQTGETCPPEPAAGEKRGPTTCWDRSVIHAEVYDAILKQWVLSGEKCPPKPECTEGDKKPGHVCENGKWVEVAEPVVEEPEVEEKCYIKFDVPWLDLLPGIPCPWWVLPIIPGLKKTKKP